MGNANHRPTAKRRRIRRARTARKRRGRPDDEGSARAWDRVVPWVSDPRDLMALLRVSRAVRASVRENARTLVQPCRSALALRSLPRVGDFALRWNEGDPLPPVRDYREVRIEIGATRDHPLPSSVTVSVRDLLLCDEPIPVGFIESALPPVPDEWSWPPELVSNLAALIAVSRPSLSLRVEQRFSSLLAVLELRDGMAVSNHPLEARLVQTLLGGLTLRHGSDWPTSPIRRSDRATVESLCIAMVTRSECEGESSVQAD